MAGELRGEALLQRKTLISLEISLCCMQCTLSPQQLQVKVQVTPAF